MKRIWMLPFIILVVFLVGCQQAGKEEETPTATRDKVPVLITQPVEMAFEETFLSIGEFSANDVLKVYTGGSGTVERIMVSLGDFVNAGDLLFTLDQSTFENDYKVTESQLRTQRDNARTRYKDAQNDFEQKSILYESGALAKDELDTARSVLSQTKKNYQDAATTYKVQTATLKEALEDRMVTSPIEGLVGAVYIDEKENVQNIVAMEIINDNQMFVQAMVTGKTLAYIAVGDPVRIYPDGDQTVQYTGIVERYNIVADEKSGLFEVEVLVTSPIEGIFTGTYAEIEFIIKQRNNLAILRKGIQKTEEGQFAYIVEDGIVKRQLVVTGPTNQQYIEIIDGLTVADKVVIQGQSFIEDGSLVIIQE